MSVIPRIIGITGATGSLGAAFLVHMLEQDVELRVLAVVRDPRAAAVKFSSLCPGYNGRVEFLAGNLIDLRVSSSELTLFRQVNAGWWHFAARTQFGAVGTSAETAADAVNDLGTARLLAVLRTIETPAPFFHISTAFVAGTRLGRVAESIEAIGKSFRNPYERSKAAAERHVWRYLNEGRCGAIFRPSVIVPTEPDSGSAQLAEVFASAVLAALRRRERELVLRLPHDAGINVVARDWVVRALASLSLRECSRPIIYHLTSPDDCGFATLAAEIENATSALTVRLRPDADFSELSDVSRYMDRLLAEARGYLAGGVTFDRTNTETGLSPDLMRESFALSDVVAHRLRLVGV